MTGVLASVRSLEEARSVFAEGVDIIDLKEPNDGALGAVPLEVIQSVVNEINGESVISATIGDLPWDPDQLAQAVALTASSGVDLVKVGLFEPVHSTHEECLERISDVAETGVIIVLFADRLPNLNIIDDIADAGLAGVMIDTADKQAGSLLEILSLQQLETFVRRARSRELITGIAGSLRSDDIPQLISLQADYLGFRGALCTAHQRQSQLDPLAVKQIRQRILKEEEHYGAVA